MLRSWRQTATSVDFSDYGAARGWFPLRKHGVSVLIAVRAALRGLPLIVHAQVYGDFRARVLLPTFRAVAVAWTAAEHPRFAARLRPAAAAAYAAAEIGHLHAIIHPATDAARAATAASGAHAYTGAHAFDYAAQATHASGDADAAAAFAARADAVAVEQGRPAAEIALWPLWAERSQQPERIAVAWSELQTLLLAAGDDWDVWVRWYQDRLDGRPSLGEAFDLALATLPDELWRRGPAAVNARIKELIAEHTPPAPIPAQGAGPHFALSPDLKIALAPPGEIDAAGNNMARIGQLLPVVRQAAGDLAGHLNPNAQPEISRIVGDYRAATAGEPQRIAWGTVFGLGVRLENAAAASRREIADRLRDPLEDAPQEALDSLLALHGPLMLATAEGRELSDDADRFRQTREQQAELRRDAQRIAANLRNSPEIIEAPAARLGEEAAAAIGEGPHPERGTVFGLATLKHAATIFIPAAALAGFVPVGAAAAGLLGAAVGGGFAWAGYESLKKSRMFSTATVALGPVWDQLLGSGEAQAVRALTRLAPFRNFVAQNEEPLRRIAENSTQLRWMLSYIDFVIRSHPPH